MLRASPTPYHASLDGKKDSRPSYLYTYSAQNFVNDGKLKTFRSTCREDEALSQSDRQVTVLPHRPCWRPKSGTDDVCQSSARLLDNVDPPQSRRQTREVNLTQFKYDRGKAEVQMLDGIHRTVELQHAGHTAHLPSCFYPWIVVMLVHPGLCAFSLAVSLAKVGAVAWLIYQRGEELPHGYVWLQGTVCSIQAIAAVTQTVFAYSMLSKPSSAGFIWGANSPFILLIATFTCGGVSVPSVDCHCIDLE